ncbi:hypothetical protein ACJX0J_013993, partial [Zea mays]
MSSVFIVVYLQQLYPLDKGRRKMTTRTIIASKRNTNNMTMFVGLCQRQTEGYVERRGLREREREIDDVMNIWMWIWQEELHMHYIMHMILTIIGTTEQKLH